MSARGPAVLVVCDGWGERDDAQGNAIRAARTPALDALRARWPHTTVAASGAAVGLPDGQQGNSEVGHLTIGAGRVILQPLSRITHSIADGSFFENEVLVGAVKRAIDRGSALHCMGLVSPGGVHSLTAHGLAVADLAHRRGLRRVHFHAFTDGRDVPPSSAAGQVAEFRERLRAIGTGDIASLAGRWYAMDRDRRWDRVAQAYDVIAGTSGHVARDPVAYITTCYREGVTDEFLPPVSICPDGAAPVRVESGDSVVMFNFRPDRMRELTHAMVDSDFSSFARTRVPVSLTLVSFTEYDRELEVPVAFPKEDVRRTLGEVVSDAGLRQFHVAETEKYAHVTYFVNGGREAPFAGEERLLVPSEKVATYDESPAMRAVEITDAVLDRLREFPLVVVNYANADMVGHTGDFDATVMGVETIDSCLQRLSAAVLAAEGTLIMTADHGNAEMKIDPADGSPLTAHTTSPVPVVLCGTDARDLREGGGLRDVAPTVLGAMGLRAPEEMTGRDLALR